MSYTPYYPNGWQSGQSGGTPITPEALQNMEEGIKAAMQAVESTDYPGCYYRMVDGEAEWFNPPMVPGTRYRTTERFNGRPVYVKIIDFGALPESSSKSVYTGVAPADLLSYEGIAIRTGGEAKHFPYVSTSTGEVQGRAYVDNAGNLCVVTSTDLSSFTALFTLKYLS